MEKNILRLVRAMTLLTSVVRETSFELYKEQTHKDTMKEIGQLLDIVATDTAQSLEGKKKVLKALEKEPEGKYDLETLEAVTDVLNEFRLNKPHSDQRIIDRCVQKITNMRKEIW